MDNKTSYLRRIGPDRNRRWKIKTKKKSSTTSITKDNAAVYLLVSDYTTRVGWICQRANKIISHSCYAKDHISPQFQLKLFQFDQIVANDEALTEEERSKVPDDLHASSKSYLKTKDSNPQKTSDSRTFDWRNWQGGSLET